MQARPLTLFLAAAIALNLTGCSKASPEESRTADSYDNGDSAEGEGQAFRAKQSCPAYQSKNKKTNPGSMETATGTSYEVIELNRPDKPDWVRLRMPGANPAERWVELSCGELIGETVSTTAHDDEDEDAQALRCMVCGPTNLPAVQTMGIAKAQRNLETSVSMTKSNSPSAEKEPCSCNAQCCCRLLS